MADIATEYRYDPVTEQMVVKRTQDVEPYLDRLQALRGVTDGRGKDMHYAGQIPMVVVEQYLNKHRVTFEEFLGNPVHMQRLLNDPDFKKLRVWGGRL